MKPQLLLMLIALFAAAGMAQSPAAKIYETEKAFEKMAADKGVSSAFIEFMAPMGVMFVPEQQNAREFWKSIPPSTSYLTWNPIWIDAASNGMLGYSIGNSIRRPKGKDDPEMVYGHYISIWTRRTNGEYRALLDAGINHPKPASIPTEWKSPLDGGGDKNEGRLSAADSAVPFYATVEANAAKAYKSYLTNDAIMMRSGKEPFVGKKAAIGYIENEKPTIRFSKRKSFVEGPDIAYVYSVYSIVDNKGKELEGGNFVQVWKLRKGKWLIAADVLIASPKGN
ncbi:MAG: nuclear transport factor 2 family protein [bacterium]|nr:nuclear transport factor 2 family protein [bacterium]